jgi:DNA polymerase I-like protein with 3'-5' exonuclease and polymerase domains|tara:strand:+ start:831 stop:1958 length:1128 start_codon:yes stop_codon:yes gene_type:complete
MEELTQVLRNKWTFVGGALFTPKRDNSTQGYIAGAEFQRLKEFNPTSRDHIAWILTNRLNVKLNKITTTGKPIIDEITLMEIDIPFSRQCAKCLTIKKKLGMISEGVNAWNKLVTTKGKIHHNCSVSTNTFRCAHRKPNLAQVPSDKEFRELFTASPKHIMVGADLSGIELRMLAHYLGRYDGGRYADILLNDDIHQVNADKIGITRRQVKTVTYAFLYGAGNEKIGMSYDNSLQPKEARKKGSEIREAFVSAIEGLSDLLGAVSNKAANGYLLALDGRRVLVDSPHKALNYLLQCSAGIVAKRWMVIANDAIHNPHTHQLAFVHDELQYETPQEDATNLMNLLEKAAELAGEYYDLRCPIAAESKQGKTWADVH